MRFDEAKAFVTERSRAINGGQTGISGHTDAEQIARMLFSGVLDAAALEEVLDGLEAATQNALMLFALAPQRIDGSLYGILGQVFLTGVLFGSGRPRGGGASQTPSDDFEGATE